MRGFVFIFILLFLPGMAQAGKMVKVKVQKSTIFQQPKFFSKVVTSVNYGDQLEMLDKLKDTPIRGDKEITPEYREAWAEVFERVSNMMKKILKEEVSK